MQQLFNPPLPPSTMHSSAPSARRAVSAGAWACSSSHPAALLGDLCPRCSTRALKHVAACSKSTRPLEAICTKKNIMPTMSHQGKFFEAEMTVRDCDDINKHGIVNDAMYACYIEKAREDMFSSFGIRMSSIARTGRAMAVSEFDFKYFTPLKHGDNFVVMVRIAQIKGVRLLLEYFVETLPERTLVLEAMATGVCLNRDYRPTRVYPEISEMLEFFSDPTNDPGKLP